MAARTVKEATGRRGGGGPAASGGYNFQAAVTAVALAYAARRAPLGWLEGVARDCPLSVAAETGGPGDDLRLSLEEGGIVEAQVKKGLQVGADMWSALGSLAASLDAGRVEYGLLVVCPESSLSVRRDLARDVVRIGEGQREGLCKVGAALIGRLTAEHLDPANVCQRLRIVTVSALQQDGSSVLAARAELGHVCLRDADISAAWDRLYRDAHLMVERRGSRSREAVLQTLTSAGIELRRAGDGPGAVLARLNAWTLETTKHFSILGVREPLPIDDAWIELTPVVQAAPAGVLIDSLTVALENYHAWDKRRPGRDDTTCEAETLGRFQRRAVVVAGPGMGKSTLLKKLARAYATDGLPVLRVSAPTVARSMRRGDTFEAAVFAHGLDGSGITSPLAAAVGLSEWVVLCDGLDECGADQELIADGLCHFAAGHPDARIVVTTRPIGYRTALLAGWRHYEIASLASDSADRHLVILLDHILSADDPRREALRKRVEGALERSKAGKAAARSPLLLGLCAALFARGGKLGRTRLEFYRAIFDLIEAEPPPRAGEVPASSAVLRRVLDLVGWWLVAEPVATFDEIVERCAKGVGTELGLSPLRAREVCDACLSYWQELGVLERVHHAGDDAVTFVHKTFGEFAAGRYMAALSPDEQRAIVTSRGELDTWNEVFSFGASLGSGDAFCEALIARGFGGEPGQKRLLQCLEIVAEAEPSVVESLGRQVIQAAVSRLASDHRTWAHQVAASLTPVARRAPAWVLPLVRPLLADPQPWTRLGAWAAVAEASGGEGFAAEDLLDALLKLLPDFSGGLKRNLGGGWSIGDTGEEVLRGFASHVATTLLATLPPQRAHEAIHSMFQSGALDHMNFVIEMNELLRSHGLPDDLERKWRSSLKRSIFNVRPKEFVKAQREAYAKTLGSVAVDSVSEQPLSTDRPLYMVSAFLEVTGFKQSPLSDCWGWQHDYDPADVSHVFGAVAAIAGIPADQLAIEADELRTAVLKDEREAISVLFERTPDVDVGEPNWDQAKNLDLDFARIGRTLQHRSSVVVENALKLAIAGGSEVEWRRLVDLLLRVNRRYPSWAASNLARRLPRNEAADLLYGRAVSEPGWGAEYIVQGLEKVSAADDPRRLDALRAILLSDHEDAAVAAADWLVREPLGQGQEIEELVREAFDHWKKTEKPYPRKGGAVPTSPRAALLRARLAIAPEPLKRLLQFSRDRRPDVREVASAAIDELIASSPADRAQLVGLTLAGKVPLSFVRSALKAHVAFDPAEVESLLSLLQSDDPDRRHTAMGLLDTTYLELSRIRDLALKMRADAEPQIRERAIALLERY